MTTRRGAEPAPPDGDRDPAFLVGLIELYRLAGIPLRPGMLAPEPPEEDR